MTKSEQFLSRLSGFSVETLESNTSPIFGLDRDFRIDYLNPAWFVFAQENDGEPAISRDFGIGTGVLKAISGPLKEFYERTYQKVLALGKPWQHEYECSSPEIYRRYHQTIYPFHTGEGLLVVNSLVAAHPHAEDRSPHPPIKELYTWPSGFITQCSHCRRVQQVASPEVWDWVPDWVTHMPRETSHSLCMLCYEYYWKLRRRHT